jgi:hypothetical protein
MGEMAIEAVLTHPYYRDEDVQEQIIDLCPDLDTLWAAVPEERCELPPEGDWIILREQPYTNIPSPPLYSMWRARPVYHSRIFKRVSAGGRSRTVNWPLLRARIVTPYGELTLLPREYLRVRDLRVWLDEVGSGVTLHLMGAEPEGAFAERLFYLRARGLRYPDALRLLLPETADQALAWLSLDEPSGEAEKYEQGAK